MNCWRALGEHVVASLRRGDAVLVAGRLSVREYENRDGDRRLAVEVEATAVGPDLSRGTAKITRIRRLPAGPTGVDGGAADIAGPAADDDLDDAAMADESGPGAEPGPGVSAAAHAEPDRR